MGATAGFDRRSRPAGITLAALSLVLLPLPLLGLAWLVGGILRRIVAAAVRPLRRHRTRPATVGTPYRLQPEEASRCHGSELHHYPTVSVARRPAVVRPPGRCVAPSAPAYGVGPGNGVGPGVHAHGGRAHRTLLLRAQPRTPRHGWRRTVFAVTGGHVNPGPSAANAARNELLARVRTRFDGSRRIVVMSRKGGVGKTTTTLMLGHTFAAHRGDRVVAARRQPRRRQPGHAAPARDDRRHNRPVGEPGLGAAVLADPRVSPRRTPRPGSRSSPPTTTRGSAWHSATQDYRDLIDTVDHHYNLILVDTGTGILDDANQGILQEADQLVLVMPPALDGGRVAAMTLDWLDQHGYQELVSRAVAVINGVRGSGPLELDRLEEHFASRCASVHRIPWDPV